MTTDEEEAALYELAADVHGRGAAISYDPIVEDAAGPGTRFRGIVWNAGGEAMHSHFGATKSDVRNAIRAALKAQAKGRT